MTHISFWHRVRLSLAAALLVCAVALLTDDSKWWIGLLLLPFTHMALYPLFSLDTALASTACLGASVVVATSLPMRKVIRAALVTWVWTSPRYDSIVNVSHEALDTNIGYAIMTAQTQAAIHRHQAISCSRATVVYDVAPHWFGLGSHLHMHALVLARAIQDGALFERGNTSCRPFAHSCHDLFLPDHNCSAAQVRAMRRKTLDKGIEITPPKSLMLPVQRWLTEPQASFWWYAQAIAYLTRLTPATHSELRRLRERLHGSLPSLRGAINLNIRSGDKWQEATPIPPEAYVDRAADLIAANPLSFSRVLFVTSDSLEAILRARAHAMKRGGLIVVYSDIFRMRGGHDQSLVSAVWTRNTTYEVLLQLVMAAEECDAWVGSRTSNWNRLIDMRRCTSVPKCTQPFVEAGLPPGEYDRQMHGHI